MNPIQVEDKMTARLLTGAEVAGEILEELRAEVARLKKDYGAIPGLATILVGEHHASRCYIDAKRRAARGLGLRSVEFDLPPDLPEDELFPLIDRCNKDAEIDGVLVQLPLPYHLNESSVLCAIDPGKDVEAHHPVNIGKLMTGDAGFLPCAPAAVQELLIRSGVQLAGAEVVVLGRSNAIGKPLANMLLQKSERADATVTVCHTATRDLTLHTARADVLIVAVGVPGFLRGGMIRPGAVVIDAGANDVGRSADGRRIVRGDVTLEEVAAVASAVTPVPGGVGPLKIPMLMRNVLHACKIHRNIVH
jgi:methylenetetrahydrofolate dehydrogenase (NADP+)/methenyltetrahydrofolate cyclohydrolase